MTSVLEELNSALKRAFANDSRVYLLGEDVLDPYGGAFKVTRGLSSAYPERVLTTPLSEAGITGVAAGMALRGLHPVVEIMFGDFLSLAADQLINHISKFRWMYNDQVRLPLVIRTPMGGRRGYGPTHSQSLEKFFLGIPGLRVLAPAALSTPGNGPGDLLYRTILESEDPVLFIENKLLYLLPVQSTGTLMDFNLTALPSASDRTAPAYSLTIRGAPPPTLTLAAYGYMADLARQAVLRLAYDHEIFTELIILTQLAPFDVEPIIASVKRTSRLLVVEEGTLSLGWGAEILARASEALVQRPLHLRRLAARDLPIPASGPLEAAVLPDEEAIIAVARSMA
jgi:pyruvate/2-oxoglutarate/acetoin dehydrogenase E1 component